MLNLDYKLFTSIIAKRLEKILPRIINMDQTGFVLTRQTHKNIRRSLQINRHINQNKIQALLVSLDAEKAFNSVRWKFLFSAMERFGFNQVIITPPEALYDKPSAKLKINRELTDSLVRKINKTGLPRSPILFAIFIGPLAQWIRQNQRITGINMAAGEHRRTTYLLVSQIQQNLCQN